MHHTGPETKTYIIFRLDMALNTKSETNTKSQTSRPFRTSVWQLIPKSKNTSRQRKPADESKRTNRNERNETDIGIRNVLFICEKAHLWRKWHGGVLRGAERAEAGEHGKAAETGNGKGEDDKQKTHVPPNDRFARNAETEKPARGLRPPGESVGRETPLRPATRCTGVLLVEVDATGWSVAFWLNFKCPTILYYKLK